MVNNKNKKSIDIDFYSLPDNNFLFDSNSLESEVQQSKIFEKYNDIDKDFKKDMLKYLLYTNPEYSYFARKKLQEIAIKKAQESVKGELQEGKNKIEEPYCEIRDNNEEKTVDDILYKKHLKI